MTDEPSITLADIIANRENFETNIRQLVARRSVEHGMRPADYLIKVLLPQLARDGTSIEDLQRVVSIFDPKRESDSLT